MVDIVTGKHADDVFDGFLTALGVHSVVLPLGGCQGFQQREIGFADYAKLLYRFARIALLVISRMRKLPTISVSAR
jgi:hypothetical protein